MQKKKIVMALFLLTIIISQLSFINLQVKAWSWPMGPQSSFYRTHVYHIINDSFVDMAEEVPQIDIQSFSHVVLTGRIVLNLKQPPIVNSSYEYRMLVCWDKIINLNPIKHWPDPDWENVIPPETNFTICVAGGVSWFGVTNGSYSAYYNSKGVLVYNESKSNSVIFVGNGLQYVIKQDYITDRYFADTVQIFTSYNATNIMPNPGGTEMYLDAMRKELIEAMLGIEPSYNFDFPDFTTYLPGIIIFGCFGFVSLVIIVILIIRIAKTKR
ncbi:MAG: hypothetical protein ACTSSK_02480 [Candidatus Heimdallarchaeota archaeon]